MAYLLNMAQRRRGNRSQAYINTIVNTYGADEVWPLVDIASGTTITASVNSARNGTVSGWQLQNAAGPVTGTLAPLSDGVNDYGDIYSSNLATLFDGSTGGWAIWAKVYNANVWTDGVRRVAMAMSNDGGANQTYIRKELNPNQVTGFYEGNDQPFSRSYNSAGDTDWKLYALTWNFSSNRARFIVDGVQNGDDMSITAATSGIGPSYTVIGANSISAVFVWHGWLAYAMFWAGTEPSVSDLLAIYNAAS